MRNRLFVFPLLVLLSLFSFEVRAQDRRVERADQAFELRQYHQAIDYYRKAHRRVNRRDRKEGLRIVYQTALCYRYTNNHRMAEAWFRRAVRQNYHDPRAVLYFADALLYNGKFDEAGEQYARYTELAPDDWRGEHGLATIEMVGQLTDNPTQYEVEPFAVFNSVRNDDYTAAFGDHRASSLIFASSRDDALGREEDMWTGQKHTSLFISYQDRTGEWGRPVLLDEGPVNTEFNEGSPSLNAAATRMYFTRCLSSPDVDMGCRIMVSDREGANWGSPREVQLTKDSTVTVGHPAISPDGLELYFASDMEGSMGTMDIWVARRRSEAETFGPPENLGEPVNTKGNEMFPYMREDGTLFFASDGHIGMGGLDIFMSRVEQEGWTEPENLGVPINSTADDFGIVFLPGKEQGFLSSNRVANRGYNIYSFYLAPLLFTIQGTVTDDSTHFALPDASIQLVGSDGSLHAVETDQDGRYTFDETKVLEHTSYDLLVSKEGYFSARGRQSTLGLEEGQDFVLDFSLQAIPETPIELPEILYEFARWELQPQFKDSLNGLVQTLVDNPNIVIELASHTDSRGGHELNDTLSQRRAQSVVDYLIAQGIDPDRLEAVGYGKRKPRAIDRNLTRDGYLFEAGTILSEEYILSLPDEAHQDVAHQMNRRTEFRVIRDDFEPKETEEDQSPPGSSDMPGRGGNAPNQR